MKIRLSSQQGDLPMWGGLIVVMLLFSVHAIGLSIALLGLDPWGRPLNYQYQTSYRQYEEARQYLTQFEEPSFEARLDGREPSDLELRDELVGLRKGYAKLAYDKLFAGHTIHGLINELPIVWLVSISCICTFISLFTSMFGAYLLNGEQNGCRQRLVWHLSCHRRFPLAVA